MMSAANAGRAKDAAARAAKAVDLKDMDVSPIGRVESQVDRAGPTGWAACHGWPCLGGVKDQLELNSLGFDPCGWGGHVQPGIHRDLKQRHRAIGADMRRARGLPIGINQYRQRPGASA